MQRFQALAHDLGIAERVLFTGQLSQCQARAYTTQATVLVSPRISGTNTPLKVTNSLLRHSPGGHGYLLPLP